MKQRNGLFCAVLSALLFILVSVPASAQDFRGSINGTVSDDTGGVLPGVTVTITNIDTNLAATTVTDGRGLYQVRYLNTGTYTVEAQLDGFKSVIRKGVAVHVGDSLKIDLTLQAGGIEEVMVVTAAAPILDTSNITGQVIDSNQIEQLPLGDGTAYMLSRLAPGIMDSSDLHFSRPMDNGNLAGIVANGAMGGNEFTLDGAPNRVSPNSTAANNNSGVVGFSPPSDAIAEFKVQTNAFDAQSGHTAGATVNLALKTGTNALQASVAYFNRSDSRSATPLLSKRANAEKPTRAYDRYTGTLSGPIIRDHTFFLISFEHLLDVQPEPSTYTVPTAKMRNGDMSEWGVPIYDPLTATGSANTRTAFAGGIIPTQRINPVARAYALLYPEANRDGLENNYFTNQLRPYDYNAFLIRLDHNFNASHRLFGNGYWNKREEDRYNWALGAANATGAGEINGFEVTHGFDYRSNRGATLGYTTTQSSSLLFDVIGAWSRFDEFRDPAQEFDLATLGFAPASLAAMEGYNYLPLITFGGFSAGTNADSRIASLGAQRSDYGAGFNRPFTNMSVSPTVNWLYKSHTVRSGYELRAQRWEIDNAPYIRFHFNGAYTRLNNSGPLNDPAQGWAQFLLGLPTTGTNTVATPGSTASQFEIAADADYKQASHALFLQDDWHVNNNLTLNFGVRFELHQALTESDDRNLAGFDSTISSPIEAAAVAKYAAAPFPELPASQFRVKGALQFADGAIYDDLHKVLPRAAFSYLLGPKTLIRGGVGLFSYDYYFDAGNQTGFSQPTPVLTTNNNGTTFLTDLTNPLPSGQLIQPPGSSLGAATGLGLTIGTIVPTEREIPYYTRWQIGMQRDLGAGWVVEVNYVDSRGTNLPVFRELNGLPFQYLSTSRERDAANETFLSGNVANPFAGLMAGTTINGANISRGQLLRPYPQFLAGAVNGAVSGTGTVSVGTVESVGSDRYQAGSIRVEKRFTSGHSLLATYTRSKLRDKLNYLNPGNGILEDRISPNDRPHRGSIGGTYQIPFGQGKRWGNGAGPFVEALLGGWSISGTYQYQTGFPLTWNTNVYYDPARDPQDLRGHIGGKCPDGGIAGLDCAAWDISGFYIPGGTGRSDPRIALANNVRYFPSTLEHVRTDDLHLMDIGIYKTFSLPMDVDLQLRIETINALNYTVLWNPNQTPNSASFGFINQDRNNPRDIQIAAKLSF